MNSRKILSLLAVSFLVLSFNAYSKEWPLSPAETQALPGAYEKAVKDAEFTSFKKAIPVESINPWNPRLVWNPNHTKVLMVSVVPKWLIDNKTYAAGGTYTAPDWPVKVTLNGRDLTLENPKANPSSVVLQKDFKMDEPVDVKLLPEDARRALYGLRTIWMTPYPQVKHYLHHLVGGKLRNLKIREYTGLSIDMKKPIPEQFAVEMWVNPHDLIRPCPNPDVIQQVCIPSAPFVRPGPESYTDVFSYLRRTDQLTYEFWFKSNAEFTYVGQYPFPWTRMGYSYNWDPTTHNHHGASEFILRPGATAEVQDVVDLKDY